MSLPTSREGWDGVRAVVHGFGDAGAAAADNLLFLGADVTALDGRDHPDEGVDLERAELLRTLGADIRLGERVTTLLPDACDLLVVTGWELDPDEPPSALEQQAASRGVPVWSGAELAWRLREEDAAPWLVTARGSADRPEVQGMLAAIARAAGLRPIEVWVGGVPLVEAVMDPDQPDLLIVELTGPDLAHTHSVSAESAAVLSSADPALARAFERVRLACVYDVADPGTERFVEDAEVQDGARAIGITLGTPGVSMLGVVEDILVDRAFIEERRTSAAELATLADLFGAGRDPEPALVRAALAAAALARAHGLSQAAVRDGLRAWVHVDSPGDE